jgi:IS66 C-terminal element
MGVNSSHRARFTTLFAAPFRAHRRPPVSVDPQIYFTDVLTKLVNLWPASRLDELMPWTRPADRSTSKLAA